MHNAIVPAPAELITPKAGATAIQRLGETELQVQAELQARSQAATAKALVEARYTMALHRPRDFDAARERLLNDCRRPGFAEAAIYSKPVGASKIEGLSIKFVEGATRALGNIHSSVQVIWDDPDRRIIHVEATDLESNTTFADDAIIDKTTERSRAEGRDVIKERRNSKGNPVFVVRATEDELLVKQSAVASKRLRNCLLRLVPGDLADEARQECERTIAREASQNLPEKREKMKVAFARLDRPVSLEDLAKYLGHAPEQATTAEIADLQRVYIALKDGETTWAEVLEAKRPTPTVSAPTPGATSKPSPADSAGDRRGEQSPSSPATAEGFTQQEPASGGQTDPSRETGSASDYPAAGSATVPPDATRGGGRLVLTPEDPWEALISEMAASTLEERAFARRYSPQIARAPEPQRSMLRKAYRERFDGSSRPQ